MLLKYPSCSLKFQGIRIFPAGPRQHAAKPGSLESVRAYLIQVAPDLSNRLVSHGYGTTQPKADNKTAKEERSIAAWKSRCLTKMC